MKTKGVLFVCMGNICRSPALAAALQKLAEEKGVGDQLFIDSPAMTTDFIGKQADHRILAVAEKRGEGGRSAILLNFLNRSILKNLIISLPLTARSKSSWKRWHPIQKGRKFFLPPLLHNTIETKRSPIPFI